MYLSLMYYREMSDSMKLKEIILYLKSDCKRYTNSTNLINFIKLYFSSYPFRWQVAFRLSKGRGIIKCFGMILWILNRSKNNIVISRLTDIGYGLYLGHGGPIVVNYKTKIGNNCNLSHFVSIGTNENNPAVIGNNVYIGPNTNIVENVKIGDNVTIGAGSVVTKDLPDNCTAAGNYAKVLNYKNPGKYIKNKW